MIRTYQYGKFILRHRNLFAMDPVRSIRGLVVDTMGTGTCLQGKIYLQVSLILDPINDSHNAVR